jgi:hypothetical protein
VNKSWAVLLSEILVFLSFSWIFFLYQSFIFSPIRTLLSYLEFDYFKWWNILNGFDLNDFGLYQKFLGSNFLVGLVILLSILIDWCCCYQRHSNFPQTSIVGNQSSSGYLLDAGTMFFPIPFCRICCWVFWNSRFPKSYPLVLLQEEVPCK